MQPAGRRHRGGLLGHAVVGVDPVEDRPVTPGREDGGALDHVPAGGVRPLQPPDYGADLGVIHAGIRTTPGGRG